MCVHTFKAVRSCPQGSNSKGGKLRAWGSCRLNTDSSTKHSTATTHCDSVMNRGAPSCIATTTHNMQLALITRWIPPSPKKLHTLYDTQRWWLQYPCTYLQVGTAQKVFVEKDHRDGYEPAGDTRGSRGVHTHWVNTATHTNSGLGAVSTLTSRASQRLLSWSTSTQACPASPPHQTLPSRSLLSAADCYACPERAVRVY